MSIHKTTNDRHDVPPTACLVVVCQTMGCRPLLATCQNARIYGGYCELILVVLSNLHNLLGTVLCRLNSLLLTLLSFVVTLNIATAGWMVWGMVFNSNSL